MAGRWGGVARRGARNVRDDETPVRPPKPRQREAPPAWEPERWEREPVREAAGRAVARAKPAHQRPPKPGSAPRQAEPRGRQTAAKRRFAQAVEAYEHEHYKEARSLLGPLVDREPEQPSYRELLGLTFYRLGRWKPAIAELEAFERLAGTVEQHPVLADCYRALKRWRKVAELWEELRAASPGADLVAEGRIVAAGALADRGDLPAAIALLEASPRARKIQPRHLRLWYALADLYERAGDLPRARELFHRVETHDPEFHDVTRRRRAIDR